METYEIINEEVKITTEKTLGIEDQYESDRQELQNLQSSINYHESFIVGFNARKSFLEERMSACEPKVVSMRQSRDVALDQAEPHREEDRVNQEIKE